MWQVYGAMEPAGYVRGLGDVHGPLAVKRWVRKASDPKYKMHYKPRRYAPAAGDNWSTEDYNEDRAFKYAEWLAQRDGITLPQLKRRVNWAGVYVKRGEREVYSKRVRSVSWGRDVERYTTRKDGRRGAWLYNEFVAEFTIEIPHWDFVGSVEEETKSAETADYLTLDSAR